MGFGRRVRVQLDHRSACATGPLGRLGLVALQDADVVQRRQAAGAEERGPVSGDGKVEPHAVHHERRRGAQARHAVAPRLIAEIGGLSHDVSEPGDVGGQHHAVGRDLLAIGEDDRRR